MAGVSLEGLCECVQPLLATFGDDEVTARLDEYMDHAREQVPRGGLERRRRLYQLVAGYVHQLIEIANMDNRKIEAAATEGETSSESWDA